MHTAARPLFKFPVPDSDQIVMFGAPLTGYELRLVDPTALLALWQDQNKTEYRQYSAQLNREMDLRRFRINEAIKDSASFPLELPTISFPSRREAFFAGRPGRVLSLLAGFEEYAPSIDAVGLDCLYNLASLGIRQVPVQVIGTFTDSAQMQLRHPLWGSAEELLAGAVKKPDAEWHTSAWPCPINLQALAKFVDVYASLNMLPMTGTPSRELYAKETQWRQGFEELQPLIDEMVAGGISGIRLTTPWSAPVIRQDIRKVYRAAQTQFEMLAGGQRCPDPLKLLVTFQDVHTRLIERNFDIEKYSFISPGALAFANIIILNGRCRDLGKSIQANKEATRIACAQFSESQISYLDRISTDGNFDMLPKPRPSAVPQRSVT